MKRKSYHTSHTCRTNYCTILEPPSPFLRASSTTVLSKRSLLKTIVHKWWGEESLSHHNQTRGRADLPSFTICCTPSHRGPVSNLLKTERAGRFRSSSIPSLYQSPSQFILPSRFLASNMRRTIYANLFLFVPGRGNNPK